MSQYIFYGSIHFDPYQFEEIKNRTGKNKPYGGLWASSYEKDSWKMYNEKNPVMRCDDWNSFLFHLSPSAKVLNIRSNDDLIDLYIMQKQKEKDLSRIDFEFLKDHYDAVELFSNDDQIVLKDWDAESILVMNKDVIIEDRREAVSPPDWIANDLTGVVLSTVWFVEQNILNRSYHGEMEDLLGNVVYQYIHENGMSIGLIRVIEKGLKDFYGFTLREWHRREIRRFIDRNRIRY